MSDRPLFLSGLWGDLRGHTGGTDEASESELTVSVLVYWPDEGDVTGRCCVYVHSGSCCESV